MDYVFDFRVYWISYSTDDEGITITLPKPRRSFVRRNLRLRILWDQILYVGLSPNPQPVDLHQADQIVESLAKIPSVRIPGHSEAIRWASRVNTDSEKLVISFESGWRGRRLMRFIVGNSDETYEAFIQELQWRLGDRFLPGKAEISEMRSQMGYSTSIAPSLALVFIFLALSCAGCVVYWKANLEYAILVFLIFPLSGFLWGWYKRGFSRL
jgi:hypothetical protein